jgi:dethiobiotin synthetase
LTRLSTPGIFVTGTNTGVGKTVIAAAIVRMLCRQGLRVAGLKPIASGSERNGPSGTLRNIDALELQAASSFTLPYERVNPFCFEPAIAPHIAAAEAGRPIELAALLEWYATATAGADIAVLEGAGGWRVPLHPDGFLSDLPEHLGLGVVLVVGLTLGCLNHARLTAEAIRRSGRCRWLGWIGNAVDANFERREENIATLSVLLDGTPLALVPDLTEHPLSSRGIPLLDLGNAGALRETLAAQGWGVAGA